jgi:CBS domain-containing protein
MELPSSDSARSSFDDAGAVERLSRVTVHDLMRSPAVVFVGAEHLSLRDAAGRRRHIYVIERDGRLAGWMNTSELGDDQTAEDLVTHLGSGMVTVSPEDTAADALSRMLELGLSCLPVTDADDRLVGEVTMTSIEGAALVEEAR